MPGVDHELKSWGDTGVLHWNSIQSAAEAEYRQWIYSDIVDMCNELNYQHFSAFRAKMNEVVSTKICELSWKCKLTSPF